MYIILLDVVYKGYSKIIYHSYKQINVYFIQY